MLLCAGICGLHSIQSCPQSQPRALGMKASPPVVLEENALTTELASLRAALTHYQHASDAGALQLQRRSFDTNAALERQKQLEAENERLTHELSVLSRNPNKQPHPATLSVTELTLAHRRLSDRLSSTESLLLDRTVELNHALRHAETTAAVAARSQALVERARLDRENEAKKSRGLQSRTKAAVEEKLMLERIVEDYAALVRGMERKSSERGSAAALPSPSTPSHPSGLIVQAETGRVGLQRLLEEMNATVEPLQQHNFRLQTEIDDLRLQLEVERRGGEEDRTKLALARVSLEQYLCDDQSAAKLVSRYMKFSQTSIDLLQTALDTQRTRGEARVVTLEGQLEILQKSLADSRLQTLRLRDALDELTEDISRETFGRRREIALRLKLVSREEQVAEALRTLVRRLEEGCGRLSMDEDGTESYTAASQNLLSTISKDAAGLLQALDGGNVHRVDDGENTQAGSLDGSLARVIASEETVTTLVMELERETERRLTLERRLGEYLSGGGSSSSAGDPGFGIPTPSDLGVGWSKETLVPQQLTVHPISPFQLRSFGQPASSPLEPVTPAVTCQTADYEATQPVIILQPVDTLSLPLPEHISPSLDHTISISAHSTPLVQSQELVGLSLDEHHNETVEPLTVRAESPKSPDHSITQTPRSPLHFPSPSETPSTPINTETAAPDVEINAILDDLSKASGQYSAIANTLKNCAATLAKLKAQATLPPPPSPLSSEISLAKAYLARLNDVLEDCQVEVEILMADEARLIHGFQTILSIPAALTNPDDRHRFVTEVKHFIRIVESDATGRKATFQRKANDVEHDIALLKSSLHQMGSIESVTPMGDEESSSSASASSWPWPTNLLASPANRSRPTSPAPTFGSTMTQRSSRPRTLSTASSVASGGVSSSLVDLPFRTPMPKPVKPAALNPTAIAPSLSIPGRLNPFLMKSRTVSSSGILTPANGPHGATGARFVSMNYRPSTPQPISASEEPVGTREVTETVRSKTEPAASADGCVGDGSGSGTEVDDSMTDIE
ncbi:hypothetical protein FRB93_009447 [Tulasnella sp. JGI-2019a]|nr:hypothetical protein FRB93_009447 [Tulasnella sp. JGI-2019a]